MHGLSANLNTSSISPAQVSIPRQRPARWWIPIVLLALFVIQSLWFIRTQSLTYDEPGHIIAGLEAWQHGRFEMWTDHPPLGRFWLTLPIAAAHIEITQEALPRGYRVTAMRPGPEWLAWHTRPMNTLLGVALGLALWFATRSLFSEGAANVTLALFAFTPSLIANFSVTTTDGIGALFVFLSAWQIVRWRRNPDRKQTILTGIVLGGLLLSKLYTPPEMLLALILMLLLKPGRGWNSWRNLNWKPMLIALAVASLTFWRIPVSRLTSQGRRRQGGASFPNRETKTWATKSGIHLNLLVPAGEYIEGMREVALSNHRGRTAWYMGSLYRNGGPRTYYPVVIALKWPTLLLVLFLASLLLGVRRTCRAPGDLLAISLLDSSFLPSPCNRDLPSANAIYCRSTRSFCLSPAVSGSTRANIASPWHSYSLRFA